MPESDEFQSKNGKDIPSLAADISKGKKYVFLDLAYDSLPLGRVVIELFWDNTPRTCENFYQLCIGTQSQESTRNLTYKGTTIHKILPDLLIQGGDVSFKNGSGGESIYGPTFDVENFDTTLDVGVIAMANQAKGGGNGSQFFICLQLCFHLQGEHVGFGRVRRNLKLVEEISNFPHNETKPLKCIQIVNCGALPDNPQEWDFYENDGCDRYPVDPEEFDITKSPVNWLEVINNIKQQGNTHYNEGNYEAAMRKYSKVLRYTTWASSIESIKSDDCNELSVSALLNMAAVENNCKNFKQAHYHCSQALLISNTCAKAYFRRGQANLGSHDYNAALDDLNMAQELEPCNSRIRQEIERVRQIKNDCRNAEQQRYATIFHNNNNNNNNIA